MSGVAGAASSAAAWPGSNRGTTTLPLPTDAATAAIARGEASTLPWPISEAACPVSEPASVALAGTDPKYAGKPMSWSTPRPRDAAASATSACETAARCPMKAVLHELATAVENGIRPIPSAG